MQVDIPPVSPVACYSNLWFRQGDQNFSVARFFRTAFLAQALKGTKPDPVVVANELDQEARSEYERGVRSSR